MQVKNNAIHVFLIKLIEKSGKETVFVIENMDAKICYRSDLAEWFEDEAWYIKSWCERQNITVLFSEKIIDITDNKWFNTYLCCE